eukprot:TRINITY_DN12814_c0_g3_i1.p1 TRINITY_DN12814_c0_g3~~TRINITY_DN12814_c0_g3_i1.p1  ORF type:complete len:342 (-),score=46.24 TRINITY_DN12814_c0_g3_i1:19-957(-)
MASGVSGFAGEDYDEAELFGSDDEADKHLMLLEFCSAAIDGNAAKVRLLLDAGQAANELSQRVRCRRSLPDVTKDPSFDANRCSVLFLAALHGRNAVVQLLLDRHAHAGLRDIRGQTALHAAAFHNETEVMKTLLSAGAPLWPKSRLDPASPLQLAAIQGHVGAVATLLAAGAPINIGLVVGTPLMLAAQNGHLATVKVLVANTRLAKAPEGVPDGKPEPNRAFHGIGSSYASTPLDWARHNGHVAVASFLTYPTWRKWLWRRLWRRAVIVVGKIRTWHARSVDRLYRPGGIGYESARADFQERSRKREREE